MPQPRRRATSTSGRLCMSKMLLCELEVNILWWAADGRVGVLTTWIAPMATTLPLVHGIVTNKNETLQYWITRYPPSVIYHPLSTHPSMLFRIATHSSVKTTNNLSCLQLKIPWINVNYLRQFFYCWIVSKRERTEGEPRILIITPVS